MHCETHPSKLEIDDFVGKSERESIHLGEPIGRVKLLLFLFLSQNIGNPVLLDAERDSDGKLTEKTSKLEKVTDPGSSSLTGGLRRLATL